MAHIENRLGHGSQSWKVACTPQPLGRWQKSEQPSAAVDGFWTACIIAFCSSDVCSLHIRAMKHDFVTLVVDVGQAAHALCPKTCTCPVPTKNPVMASFKGPQRPRAVERLRSHSSEGRLMDLRFKISQRHDPKPRPH